MVEAGTQKRQASAQRSLTNLLIVKLAVSEHAPSTTSLLHVTSPAVLLQSGRASLFVVFAIHRQTAAYQRDKRCCTLSVSHACTLPYITWVP